MVQGFLTSTHDITWQTKANAEPFYQLRLNENDFFMVGDVDEVAAKNKDKKAAYEQTLAEEGA